MGDLRTMTFSRYFTLDFYLNAIGYTKAGRLDIIKGEQVTDDDIERIDMDFARKTREVVRWLGANNTDISSIVATNKAGVIGQRLNIQSRIGDNELLNQEIEDWIAAWSRKGSCEVTKRFHFNAALRAMVEFTDKDGGFLVRHHVNPKWPELYRFELIELGMIDISKDDEERNLINGLQRDEFGAVTGVWIFKDSKRIESTFVPMANLEYFAPVWISLSQYTAVSKFASALGKIDKIEQYSDEELRAAINRAKAGRYWKTQMYDDILKIVRNIQDTEKRQLKMKELSDRIAEQGIKPQGLSPIPLGDDIVRIDEPGASVYPNLVKNSKQDIAASIGVPSQIAYKDASESNYSSIKAMMAFAGIEWGIRFDDLEYAVIRPILDKVIAAGVLKGDLKIDDYWQNTKKYHKLNLMRVTEIDIEPGKTATANKTKLETGEVSLRELCAKRGRDVKDVIRERIEDELYETRLRQELGVGERNDTDN